ncbi:MAG: tyrosine-type recombinase/integrase, partial [Rudaea sp.]
MATDDIMNRRVSMTERVRQYLRARRATGLRLRIEGQQLLSFARFADARRSRGPLTTELSVRWAYASVRAGPVGRARRLEVIRPFARYLAAFDERTEIPAPGLLGPAHRRKAPHIYTASEITQLLRAAARLPPAGTLRRLTMQTFLGLLTCTGLRPAEAVRLCDADVDLRNAVLTIRQTKFQKSRLVPLHVSTSRALQRYRATRVPVRLNEAFFMLDGAIPLTLVKAERTFAALRQQLNWPIAGQRRPRLYDLRHTFACRRLISWCAQGVDVHHVIASLATYLGHVKVSDTYWYLSATPE